MMNYNNYLHFWEALFENLNKQTDFTFVWKKIDFLEDSLSGKLDLDLMVFASDQSYKNVLRDFGFWQLIDTCASNPYIEHYYLVNDSNFPIFHIHLYKRILTGLGPFKEYSFPACHTLKSHLEPSNVISCLKVISPNMRKLINLFRFRVKDHFLAQHYYNVRKREIISHERENIQKYNLINPTFELLDLQKVLKETPVINWKIDLHSYVHSIVKIILCKLRLAPRKSIQKTGLFIAIIGPDGVGKSTIVSNLYSILGTVTSVKIQNFGRVINNQRTRAKPEQSKPATSSNSTFLKSVVSALIIAHIRCFRFIIAHLWINLGHTVLSDRLPGKKAGMIDGPRLAGNKKSIFSSIISQYELFLYSLCPMPDKCIILNANLETIIQRNKNRDKPGKETDSEIVERYKLFQSSDFNCKEKINLSNDKSKGQIISEILNVIRTNK